MSYFGQEFISFFKDLSNNNTSEWFDANRKRYEQHVKKPFKIFTEEMIRRIQHYEPEIEISAADAISRINKDIRFSKDKTPYNTHLSANISRFGKKNKEYPGFYFQLGADKIMIFGGAYMVEKDTLQHIRTEIASNPQKLERILNNKDFKEKFGEIQGEKQKRLQPEFLEVAKDHPVIANKQFYYSAELNADLITKPELPDVLMEYYSAAKPVNDYLKEALA